MSKLIFELPMTLLCDGVLYGTITGYGYETPWATGKVEPVDTARHARLLGVCLFLNTVDNFPDGLTDEVEEEWYEEGLRKYRITEEEVERWYRLKWSVVTVDRVEHEMYALYFSEGGFVDWRW